jgi:hypothetical protein
VSPMMPISIFPACSMRRMTPLGWWGYPVSGRSKVRLVQRNDDEGRA